MKDLKDIQEMLELFKEIAERFYNESEGDLRSFHYGEMTAYKTAITFIDERIEDYLKNMAEEYEKYRKEKDNEE